MSGAWRLMTGKSQSAELSHLCSGAPDWLCIDMSALIPDAVLADYLSIEEAKIQWVLVAINAPQLALASASVDLVG
jgi:hypothetical protein